MKGLLAPAVALTALVTLIGAGDSVAAAALAGPGELFTVADSAGLGGDLAAGAAGWWLCAGRLEHLDRARDVHVIAGVARCRAVAGENSGSVLISTGSRVLRLTGESVVVVAGNGGSLDDFSADPPVGDGGPALNAPIDAADVAPQPDGGFLIAEMADIRRVWPDGHISTVAGTGMEGQSGDGGPATSAQVYEPVGIAATPDGGFLIAQPDTGEGFGRIRKVDAAGVITTVRQVPEDLKDIAVDSAARVWFATAGSQLFRIAANRALRVRRPGEVQRIAPDADGGLAITSDVGIQWIAPRAPRHLALALSREAGRVTPRGYSAAARTTIPARFRTEIRRRGHVVARARGLTVRGRFRPGVYTVVVTASARAERAVAATRVVLGGVVPAKLARAAINGDFAGSARAADGTDNTNYGLAKCRRFSARRYDCVTTSTDESGQGPYTCDFVTAALLRGNGLVYTRSYDCPAPRLGAKFFDKWELQGPDPPDVQHPVTVARP